ncbi:MAG TPA: hypothetical protein VF247_04110 [Candidatus Krumholzibacteria bacterium]
MAARSTKATGSPGSGIEPQRRPQGSRLSGSPRLSFIVACGVMLAAVAFLYRELVFEGKVFWAPDSMSAASLAAAGKKLLAEGHYPFWNPYIFGGMPSFGSLSFLPYVYPVNFVLGIFVRYLFFPEYSWLLFHTFLTGVGTFLLLQGRGVRYAAALVAGVLMMWMPNLVAVGANGHGSQACAVAYMPLALFFWDRLWRGKGIVVNATALAIVLGFSMLRGHLQVSYYTYALVGLHALVFGTWRVIDWARGRADGAPILPERLRRFAGDSPAARAVADVAGAWLVLVIVVGVSVAMSAVLYLPVSDYAKHSIRGASIEGGLDYSYATMWSLHPKEMLTFLVPHSFGFGKELYLGHMPFTDYPNYLGVIVLGFALVAVIAVRGRWVAFLAITWVIATLVSFGNFFPVLYDPLFKLMPFFDKFRVPVMILIVQQLATIALFGTGLGAVMSSDRARIKKIALRVLIAANVLFLLALFTQGYWKGGWADTMAPHVRATQDPSQQRAVAQMAGEFLARDILQLAVIALHGAIAVFAFARRPRFAAWALAGVILVLGCIDYYRVDHKILHPETFLKHDGYRILRDRTETERFKASDEMIDFLHAQPGEFRVLPVDGPQRDAAEPGENAPISFQVQGFFSSNRFMVFDIASAGGYHPAKLQDYEEFIGALRFSLEHGRLDLASMMNVRYIVSGVRLGDHPALKAVWVGRDFDSEPRAIYENAQAFPRAWIAGEYRVETSDEALVKMANGEVDLRRVAMLDKKPSIEPAAGDSAASVTVVKADAQHQLYQVALDRPGLLVVSEVYYPDWKATVDGAPAEVLRANHVLRAVALPAGRHEISFHYDSSRVREAAAISITTFALTLLAGAAAWLFRRKGAPWKASS